MNILDVRSLIDAHGPVRPIEIDSWVDAKIREVNALESHRALPVALVVSTTREGDWNGFFSLWSPQHLSNLEFLLETHRVCRVEIAEESDLRETMEKVCREAGRRFDVVLIQGHGCATHIQLGEDYLYEDSDRHEELTPYLSEDCRVILHACSTAPLAQIISQSARTTVLAPCAPATMLQLLYDDQGRIFPVFFSFDWEYIVRKYCNGMGQDAAPPLDMWEQVEKRARQGDGGSADFLRTYYEKCHYDEPEKWSGLTVRLRDPLCLHQLSDQEVHALAQLGDPDANALLGDEHYARGEYQEAFFYLQKAAAAHRVSACALLAVMCEFGLGIPRDVGQSASYLDQTAGDEEALSIWLSEASKHGAVWAHSALTELSQNPAEELSQYRDVVYCLGESLTGVVYDQGNRKASQR